MTHVGQMEKKVNVLTTLTEECAMISVAGLFDANCRSEFFTAVRQALTSAAPEICIDLDAVSYIDSSGLGCLLMVREEAKKASKTVKLSNLQQNVRVILNIANFQKIFRMQ